MYKTIQNVRYMFSRADLKILCCQHFSISESKYYKERYCGDED